MPPRKQYTKVINILVTEEQEKIIGKFVNDRNTTKSNLFRVAVFNQIKSDRKAFDESTSN